jgi:hypothetical protein
MPLSSPSTQWPPHTHLLPFPCPSIPPTSKTPISPTPAATPLSSLPADPPLLSPSSQAPPANPHNGLNRSTHLILPHKLRQRKHPIRQRRDSLLPTAVLGLVYGSPRLVPGSRNCVPASAIGRSVVSANCAPAAVARPYTTPTTGAGLRRIKLTTSAYSANVSFISSCSSCFNSPRSCPTQNTGP